MSIINIMYKIILVIIILLLIITLYYNKTVLENFITYKKTNITLQINGKWNIYHNDRFIKNGFNTGDKTISININNVQMYDIIKIRVFSNPGGLIGYINVDDIKYPTNKKNFIITGQYQNSPKMDTYSGGKYMGCFKDHFKRSLPKFVGNMSIQKCHTQAVKQKQMYYALQSGKQCFIGDNPFKYSSLPDWYCGLKCNYSNNGKNYCGGAYANQVFSTFNSPEILELNDNIVRKRAININNDAKWLLPKQSNLLGTFPDGIWEYVFTLKPSKYKTFCQFPKFNEFTPLGCKNPDNGYSCWKTTRKGYKPNTSKCLTLFKNSKNYNGNQFPYYIRTAWETIKRDSNNIYKKDFLDKLSITYSYSCKLLNLYGPKYLGQSLCIKNKKNCNSIPIEKRKWVSSISSDLQSVSRGSTKSYELLDLCKNRNACFGVDNDNRNICYENVKPEYQINLDKNPYYFSSISSASVIAKSYKYSNNSISRTFINYIKELTKISRIIVLSNDKLT